ncbi:MAG: hypothetical protein U1F43_39280, partial [Myxococcota bacterium]
DELGRVLARRHRALVAATAAARAGKEPSLDEDVVELTTALERGQHRGSALLSVLVGLQREAMVEAGRRGWLLPERAMALAGHLATLVADLEAPPARDPRLPPPRPPAADRLAAVTHVATAIYAALMPLAASQRLTTVAVGAAVGALLIALDALASE